MIIRAATAADVAAMERVAASAEGPPPGGPAPDSRGIPSATQSAYFGHLVSRGRVAVAEEDDGAVIGFGATVWTGRAQHLADLFVLPDRQGQGLGRRLLDAVVSEERPLTTFASDDPRALPLYVRAGMAAYWPNLYLAGDPAGLPATPSGLTVEDATLDAVAELGARWSGVERTAELPYWATLDGMQVHVARAGAVPVGVALSRDRLSGPGRWIDHAIVDPAVDGPPVLLALVRAGLAGAELGGACVPGPSPLVRTLLVAGFTIRDRDTFLASDPSIVDPYREIVDTGLL